MRWLSIRNPHAVSVTAIIQVSRRLYMAVYPARQMRTVREHMFLQNSSARQDVQQLWFLNSNLRLQRVLDLYYWECHSPAQFSDPSHRKSGQLRQRQTRLINPMLSIPEILGWVKVLRRRQKSPCMPLSQQHLERQSWTTPVSA